MHRKNNKHFRFFFLLIVSLTSLNACATNPTDNIGLYDEFIDSMVSKHQFDRNQLTALLKQAKLQPSILKAISSPAERRLEWHSYRNIFLQAKRIDGGISFWQDNKKLLQDATEKYSVPAEIIVAIIGVETQYGGNTGSYKVLDSLTTLGFHFPKRASFFKRELEEFLLLCREEGLNPRDPTGSYAGAMGKSQFISSSYRAYAVDGDNDKKRDLWNSNADIINSVANYFARHGWKDSPLITAKTTVSGEAYKTLLNTSLKPVHTIQELKQHQVNVPTDLPGDTRVKLLELNQVDQAEYWLAFDNFYTITRYNHSHLYAMAVYQLSQEIKNGVLAAKY